MTPAAISPSRAAAGCTLARALLGAAHGALRLRGKRIRTDVGLNGWARN